MNNPKNDDLFHAVWFDFDDVYLERIDRARDMARYYRLSIVETLFGEFAMVASGAASAAVARRANTGAGRVRRQ